MGHGLEKESFVMEIMTDEPFPATTALQSLSSLKHDPYSDRSGRMLGRKTRMHAFAAWNPASRNAAPTRASTTSARTLVEIFRLEFESESASDISVGDQFLALTGLVMTVSCPVLKARPGKIHVRCQTISPV